MNIPNELDKAIDALYKQREKVSKLKAKQKEKLDIEKTAEKELETLVYALLRDHKTSAGAGRVGKAEIQDKVVPVVEDWEALYKYIGRTKQFDLLNKALKRAAVVERWNNNKQVPGVGKHEFQVLSVTKNTNRKKVVSK
jgi:cation transport regulator ChaC